jgi:hypothetical protein
MVQQALPHEPAAAAAATQTGAPAAVATQAGVRAVQHVRGWVDGDYLVD